MSSIQNNVATQIGGNIQPRPMDQDAKDQAREVEELVAAEAPAEEQEVTSEDVRSAVAQLKQVVEAASGNQLNFDLYEETKAMFVEIKDVNSGEVIKQIPAEEVLSLHKRMGEIVGMILDAEG